MQPGTPHARRSHAAQSSSARLGNPLRRRLPVAAALAAIALAAGALCVDGAPSGGDAGASTASTASFTIPLATSLTTAEGTWASVPMGHLHQRLNTFWQLFFLSAGGAAWTNHAGQLGIADNGGLLLATAGDGSLFVGIRPSNLLRYSAVATTVNGRSWMAVTPVRGSAASLAVAPDGRELALVQDASGGRVLLADSGSSSWHGLVTARALSSASAGGSCGALVLTSVAFDHASDPVVGGSCGRGGAVGLFADDAGRWRSLGLSAPSLTGRSPVAVVSVKTSAGRLGALLAVASRSGPRLVEAWLGPGGGWQESTRLSLGSRGELLSVGQAVGGGEFVLYRAGKDREHLATIGGPGAPWTRLADPPEGTATVAFPAAGRVDALVAHDTVMTDWVLDAGSAHWAKRQVTHVQILFGSST
jgi:hypothetical protein